MIYLGKAALRFTHAKTWVKFCLPTLHFLMGRTEGKNGSFIAIRMRIHQKLCSSGSYAQISNCYVHMWYICYCYCIAGHSLGALMYLKLKLSTVATSPAAMVVYLDLEYIVFFFAEYCCPDPLFEDSRGCGGVTLGQF